MAESPSHADSYKGDCPNDSLSLMFAGGGVGM